MPAGAPQVVLAGSAQAQSLRPVAVSRSVEVARAWVSPVVEERSAAILFPESVLEVVPLDPARPVIGKAEKPIPRHLR